MLIFFMLNLPCSSKFKQLKIKFDEIKYDQKRSIIIAKNVKITKLKKYFN